jgi:hypothetical protein
MRKLHRVELLVLDDLGLHRLESTETSDFYELIVERHRKASTIITSNREPPEILTMMADPLLSQSAMDRLQSAAYELIWKCGGVRPMNPLGPLITLGNRFEAPLLSHHRSVASLGTTRRLSGQPSPNSVVSCCRCATSILADRCGRNGSVGLPLSG